MKEILFFTASWCVPCKQMKPIVAKIEEETGIVFKMINPDTEYDLSSKYGIRSVPTFVCLEDGVEVSRASGLQTSKELAAALTI